jgi:hypothetical protein
VVRAAAGSRRCLATVTLMAANVSAAAGCSLLLDTSGVTGGPARDSGASDGSAAADSVADTAPDGDATTVPDDAGSIPETGTMGDTFAQDAPTGQDVAGDAGSDATSADAPTTDSAGPDVATQESGGMTTDVNPTKDAYVEDSANANTNFGTATELIVKTRSSVGTNRNTWVTFDIAPFSSITSAVLRLYVSNLDMSNQNTIPLIVMYAPTASDAWVETGITWNNAPASGTAIAQGSVDSTSLGTWFEIDVTNAVRTDSDGASTFVITSTPTTNRGVLFSSREGPQPPVLRIVK